MGLDYYIIPEEQTDCADNFPDRLSSFFEQVGGYEEAAEVAQVSRILQIDLSVFQQISYDEEEGYEDDDDDPDDGESAEPTQPIWHTPDAFAAVVDELLARIAAFPDYHRQVLHNPDRKRDLDALHRIIMAGIGGNEAEAMRQFEALEKQPLYAYPPDSGYLSQGDIVEDLQALRQTLACYQSRGVRRFRLLYR